MTKFKHKLKNILYFLRLTDDDGILSITHIACMVVLYKIALEQNPSIADMGALLVTLSLYYGKQHLNRNKVKVADETVKRISDAEDKIKSIQGTVSSVSAQIGLGNLLKK